MQKTYSNMLCSNIIAKSICRSSLQQRALLRTKSKLKLLDSLDFLWYNGTYESRSVLPKVDMHFCSNVVSLANLLLLLKNSDGSYCNQCTIYCFITLLLIKFHIPIEIIQTNLAKIIILILSYCKFFVNTFYFCKYFSMKNMNSSSYTFSFMYILCTRMYN